MNEAVRVVFPLPHFPTNAIFMGFLIRIFREIVRVVDPFFGSGNHLLWRKETSIEPHADLGFQREDSIRNNSFVSKILHVALVGNLVREDHDPRRCPGFLEERQIIFYERYRLHGRFDHETEYVELGKERI